MSLRPSPRRLATLFVVAVCASALTHHATAQEVGVGAYRCEAERAVSIRHEEDGTPVTGAETPAAHAFALTIAPADPDDRFMTCMAIAGADSDAVQDFCRDTTAPIFEAKLGDREEPWFGSFFAWNGRIETGAPTTFMNGASSFFLYAARGFFRYTLIYSEPQTVPSGFTFDYVTEQGRCDRES